MSLTGLTRMYRILEARNENKIKEKQEKLCSTFKFILLFIGIIMLNVFTSMLLRWFL